MARWQSPRTPCRAASSSPKRGLIRRQPVGECINLTDWSVRLDGRFISPAGSGEVRMGGWGSLSLRAAVSKGRAGPLLKLRSEVESQRPPGRGGQGPHYSSQAGRRHGLSWPVTSGLGTRRGRDRAMGQGFGTHRRAEVAYPKIPSIAEKKWRSDRGLYGEVSSLPMPDVPFGPGGHGE